LNRLIILFFLSGKLYHLLFSKGLQQVSANEFLSIHWKFIAAHVTFHIGISTIFLSELFSYMNLDEVKYAVFVFSIAEEIFTAFPHLPCQKEISYLF
jgi:hypothetical protein